MKEIIERKLNELNTRYDYLEEYDKDSDRYKENQIIELRGQIRLLEYLFDFIKENEIDYKTAYENSFECNKFLFEKYNELDERINKANELLEKYNDKENNYYVPVDNCINILRGGNNE